VDESYGDVHTSHCCKWHGCKYNYGDNKKTCSVVDLGMKQEYPCEWCSMDWEVFVQVEQFDPEWVAFINEWRHGGRLL
jgi:hypothetical protein